MKSFRLVLFAVIALLCVVGCKQAKDTASKDAEIPAAADSPKPDETKDAKVNAEAKETEGAKDAAPSASAFKSDSEAEKAADEFGEALAKIIEKHEDCKTTTKALDDYYSANLEKYEQALQFFANLDKEADKEADEDKQTEMRSKVFQFFRGQDIYRSNLLSDEKLMSCESDPDLKAFWDKLTDLVLKYEPESVADEGNSEE